MQHPVNNDDEGGDIATLGALTWASECGASATLRLGATAVDGDSAEADAPSRPNPQAVQHCLQ